MRICFTANAQLIFISIGFLLSGFAFFALYSSLKQLYEEIYFIGCILFSIS